MKKAWISCLWVSALSYLGYSTLDRVSSTPQSIAHLAKKPNRDLASVAEKLAGSPSTRAYEYFRSIKATLNDHETLIDLKLHGTVWVREISSLADVGGEGARYFSLQYTLAEARASSQTHASHLAFIAITHPNLQVESLRIQAGEREEDQDEINVLKDFAGLFFYGSNQDTAGTYAYRFERKADAITKIKEKYLSGLRSTPTRVPQILAANFEGELGKDQLPKWLKGSEKSRLDLGLGKSLQNDSDFRIRELSSFKSPPELKWGFKDLQAESLFVQVTLKRAPLSRDTLKERIGSFNQLTRAEQLSSFHDLNIDLSKNEKNLAYFETEIENRSSEKGMLSFGIGVLASLSGEAAEKRLRNWYEKFPEQAHTILNAFALSGKSITPETRAFLIDQSLNRENLGIAQNAALALGSSLRLQADEASESRLAQMYANPGAGASREDAIEAIGNSGSARLFVTLIPSLKSPDISEKSRAIFALRFVAPELASPYLHAAFAAGASLQKTALRAIAFQSDLTLYADIIATCAQASLPECSGLVSRP